MNREIDRKIAELKGLCIHDSATPIYDSWTGKRCARCKRSIRNFEDGDYSHYSTSISDAWGLFCELPTLQRYDVIGQWGLYNYKPDMFISIVCDVWIAWKERQ